MLYARNTGNPAQSRCTNQRLYAAQHGLTAVPEQYTGELEAAYLAGCKVSQALLFAKRTA